MSEPTPHNPTDETPNAHDATADAPMDDVLPPTDAPVFAADETGAYGAVGADEQALQLDEGADGEWLAEAPEDPHEGATPPGYDEWPTHGGYLGCLMGVVLALVLAPVGYILFGLIGAALFKPLGYVGVWLAGVITVIVWLACFVGLVRLGWRLGKHFYREYPRPTGQPVSAADAQVEGRQA